jgi:hypothetical protein
MVTATPATVNVAVLAPPEFASTEYPSVAEPVRAAVETDTQLGTPAADQPHPSAVVTVNDPVEPADGTDRFVGVTAYVQGMPACVTVKVLPAMLMVPVRVDDVAAGLTVTTTVPLPLPERPEVTLSHSVWLAAVQEHDASVLTATERVPPAASIVADTGDMAYEQPLATPACFTRSVWPATVAVALLSVERVFAAALNTALPEPLPEPLVTVSHAALDDAVQLHPSGAVTAADTVPPAAWTVVLVGLME